MDTFCALHFQSVPCFPCERATMVALLVDAHAIIERLQLQLDHLVELGGME